MITNTCLIGGRVGPLGGAGWDAEVVVEVVDAVVDAGAVWDDRVWSARGS